MEGENEMEPITCEQEQPKPIEVVWGTSKPWKPKKPRGNPWSVVSPVIALFALAVSFFNFLFSVRPYLDKSNMNYEQRALAGDIKAQMFLADYNYQIGNTDSSILYYSMVITQPKLKEDEKSYFFVAINNLGYLYAVKIDGEDSNNIAERYFERGMNKLANEEWFSLFLDPIYRDLIYNFLTYTTYYIWSIEEMYPFLNLELEEGFTWNDEQIEFFNTIDKDYPELYVEDPTFRIYNGWNVVDSAEEYQLLSMGYYQTDSFVSEEISGCLTLSECRKLAGQERSIYEYIYFAKGDEQPWGGRLEDGDIIVKRNVEASALGEALEYNVYSSRRKSTPYRYISYINYSEN